jgi:hypothetical protein
MWSLLPERSSSQLRGQPNLGQSRAYTFFGRELNQFRENGYTIGGGGDWLIPHDWIGI